MGAHLLDIQGVLAVTGDPLQDGDAGHGVFDMNSFTLVRLMAGLNRGVTFGGQPLKGETNFSVGVAFNSAARNPDHERQRLQKKVAEGARFVMTQPVFDPDSLFRFLEATSAFRIPIIAGLWPLKSLRNAQFMANEVPGVYVPKEILERMAKYTAAEDQLKEGLDIAQEIIEVVKPSVQGLQVSAPLGQVELLKGLFDLAGCVPRIRASEPMGGA